jgi:hypothetical protein
MRLLKDVSLLNYSWFRPPNALSTIIDVMSSRSWPIFDIIPKQLPAKAEKTHNHPSRLNCKLFFEFLRLSSCRVKLIAVNITSKCYIFNLATCFDIRGPSSGTFFLLVDSTSLTSEITIFTFVIPKDTWQPVVPPLGFEPPVPTSGGSQLPLDLKRESAAARLLEMRIRIPTRAWMSVSYECCVLSGRGLCVGLITRPESHIECGVSECDLEASVISKFWPTNGYCAMKKKSQLARATDPPFQQRGHCDRPLRYCADGISREKFIFVILHNVNNYHTNWLHHMKRRPWSSFLRSYQCHLQSKIDRRRN